MTNAAAATIFKRYPTAEQTLLDTIVRTYATAGLNPPTLAVGIRDRINQAPTVHAVAARLADEALTTTDPEKWYAEALEELRTAQAAEALTKSFNANYSDAVRRHVPAIQAQAAEDLAPVFNKHLKALVTASKKLPEDKPLDMAACVDADAGTEYKTARTALTTFGTLASIYKSTFPGEIPPALNNLLPVLDLPAAVTEQVARSHYEVVKVLNESRLTGTRTIRQLATDAAADLDLTLVNVARGKYEGVTLSLATPAEMSDRRNAALTAYGREHITEGARVYVS